MKPFKVGTCLQIAKMTPHLLGTPDTPATGGSSCISAEKTQIATVAELPEWIAAHTY